MNGTNVVPTDATTVAAASTVRGGGILPLLFKYGSMHIDASIQAETTGIDIALPAASDFCTSDSPPSSSDSSGIPDSSSFSFPRSSRFAVPIFARCPRLDRFSRASL